MIPNAKVREIDSSGVIASASFGISMKDEAHLMSIMRDTLYSDKVLAVLREYSANAWDSHRMSGKKDLPIKVTLPTMKEPTLVIQDFGDGLSQEDVFQIWSQYGASTKRGTDTAVGMLGIGSKSGFSYSDSFTITSCHGGLRKTYVAVLDESEKGTVNLLYMENCFEETGVTIQIPVRSEDISEFANKAQSLFKYFEPRPVINTILPAPITKKAALTNGALFETREIRGGTWIAIMGCVPYQINLDQIQGPNIPGGGIPHYITQLSGELYFNIGDVQVSASREELKYSTKTKETLVNKLNALVDEFVQNAFANIESSAGSYWDKRLQAQVLRRLKLPVPKKYKELGEDDVPFKVPDLEKGETPLRFKVTHSYGGIQVRTLSVDAHTRLVLYDDTTRKLDGFQLRNSDYLVRPEVKELKDTVEIFHSFDDIRPELDKTLLEMKADGINIVKLSELLWTAPYKAPKVIRTQNKKHQVKTFRLSDKPDWSHPYSDDWSVEDRVPDPKDVFVLISGFKPEGNFGHYEFRHLYREARSIAKHFNISLPAIYGYKTTKKVPVLEKNIVGIPFSTWYATFATALLTPEVQKQLLAFEWAEMVDTDNIGKKDLSFLIKELGSTHPIVRFVAKHYGSKKLMHKLGYDAKLLLNKVYKLVERDPERIKLHPSFAMGEAVKRKDAMYERYPLLKIKSDDSVLGGPHKKLWVDYIKLVDKATP